MDLITRSGREGLPVADRIGMLRADLLHEPFLGISSETCASSQTVHDLKLTIGRIRGTIELYEMAKKRGDVGVVLSVGKDGKPVVRFDNGAQGTCSAAAREK